MITDAECDALGDRLEAFDEDWPTHYDEGSFKEGVKYVVKFLEGRGETSAAEGVRDLIRESALQFID